MRVASLLNLPPTSHPILPLWIITEHQIWAPYVSCGKYLMSLKNIPLILLSEKLGYEQYVENEIIIVKKVHIQ